MTVEFAEHAYIKKLEADFKRLHDIVGGMGFADMIQRIINLIAEVEKQDAEIERLHEQVQERDGVIEMILLRELRLREALQEIASLPDVRSDEAALIARKALA